MSKKHSFPLGCLKLVRAEDPQAENCVVVHKTVSCFFKLLFKGESRLIQYYFVDESLYWCLFIFTNTETTGWAVLENLFWPFFFAVSLTEIFFLDMQDGCVSLKMFPCWDMKNTTQLSRLSPLLMQIFKMACWIISQVFLGWCDRYKSVMFLQGIHKYKQVSRVSFLKRSEMLYGCISH